MPRDQLIQVRRGTTAEWAAVNPVLAIGEPGLDTTTGAEKTGDGVTAWLSLPLANASALAPILAANSAFTATFGPGSDQWLKANAAAFSFAFTGSPTYDTPTGLPTSANVKWPDATTGTFTGTIDGASNGYSGFVVTWAGSTTKTVTATGITYDASGNAVGPTGLAVS